MNATLPIIERSFVATDAGRVHIACAGLGRPILLLHQTPRSWDEFREVIPLLAQWSRPIAMDTPGFGDSEPLPFGENSIERWATVAMDLMTRLGHQTVSLVGHHTGAIVAAEIAAAFPARVEALVLSACTYIDAERRAEKAGTKVIDEAVHGDDGRHLLEMWSMRAPHYPAAGRAGLLNRFMIDALKAGPMAAEGHRVVNRYRMEGRLSKIACPTLVIAPTADPHAYPSSRRLAAEIEQAQIAEIEGGMVPLPDQMPVEFAGIISAFLRTGAAARS